MLLPATAAESVSGGEPAEGGIPAAPEPHWSHLPIWGVAAAERGHKLTLPFGTGVNYHREEQPFDINDLQISLGGDPISIKDFATIDQVNTSQWSLTSRLDAWIFPFLNVYGVAGFTSGEMNGTVGLPAIPPLDIPAQNLPLSISYEGPTYGGGATLAGGAKVSEWQQLTVFVVVDANYTITDLSFTDDRLFTDTKAKAFVFSSRLGLRGKISKHLHAGVWGGAMYQDVSEFLVGRSADSSFAFLVVQGPAGPWNAVVGGRLEVGRHLDFMVEGGLGTRSSILGGMTLRF
jgi:hypothetical protein